jgi:hypothetical protein
MASGATGVLNEACQRLHQTGPQHEGQVQRPLAPTLHDLLQPRRMFLCTTQWASAIRPLKTHIGGSAQWLSASGGAGVNGRAPCC